MHLGGAAAGAGAGLLGLTPVGWGAVAAMMTVGVVFTYMSQIESTKLREVQDDRLARKNADMLVKCHEAHHEITPCQAHEYEQNQRADGKDWQETLTPDVAIAGRMH